MGLALSLANVFSYCGINLPLHEAYLCSLCNVQYLDINSAIEKKKKELTSQKVFGLHLLNEFYVVFNRGAFLTPIPRSPQPCQKWIERRFTHGFWNCPAQTQESMLSWSSGKEFESTSHVYVRAVAKYPSSYLYIAFCSLRKTHRKQ